MPKTDVLCPNCGRDIEIMEPNVTKINNRWFCKCGHDISREKLGQLVDHIKENS